MSPAEVVSRYFASIRERCIEELVSLYAADATFVLPNGRELSGLAAIREMHLAVFSYQTVAPTLIASLIGTESAAAEIESPSPTGGVRRTANFYHFNREGLIKRLQVYWQNQ